MPSKPKPPAELTAPAWKPTPANWEIQRVAAVHIEAEPARYGQAQVDSAGIQLSRAEMELARVG